MKEKVSVRVLFGITRTVREYYEASVLIDPDTLEGTEFEEDLLPPILAEFGGAADLAAHIYDTGDEREPGDSEYDLDSLALVEVIGPEDDGCSCVDCGEDLAVAGWSEHDHARCISCGSGVAG